MDQETEGMLFLQLVEQFKPHVAAVALPKMRAQARSPYGLDETKVLLLFPLPPMVVLALYEWKRQGLLLEGVKRTGKEALKAIFRRPRMSKKEIAAQSEEWVREATTAFVRGWLSTLEFAASTDSRTLADLSWLDNAMLPKLKDVDPTGTIRAYGGEKLTPDEVRTALRAVRISLPPGELTRRWRRPDRRSPKIYQRVVNVLPPAALEFLRLRQRPGGIEGIVS